MGSLFSSIVLTSLPKASPLVTSTVRRIRSAWTFMDFPAIAARHQRRRSLPATSSKRGMNSRMWLPLSMCTTYLRWRLQSAPSAENSPFAFMSAMMSSILRQRRRRSGRSCNNCWMISASVTVRMRVVATLNTNSGPNLSAQPLRRRCNSLGLTSRALPSSGRPRGPGKSLSVRSTGTSEADSAADGAADSSILPPMRRIPEISGVSYAHRIGRHDNRERSWCANFENVAGEKTQSARASAACRTKVCARSEAGAMSVRAALLLLNHLDAHAIGRGNIAQHQAGFEFPWLDRHAHAFFLELRAEGPQVPAIRESEVIGSPLIVAGISVEMLHGFGGGRRFPGAMAADDQRRPPDTHVDLGRAA